MTFWIDAQLPPQIALWLTQRYGVTATALRELGLRDARDAEIFMAAHNELAVIVTKDSDFVDLVTRLGTPPQILWITCGNVTNRRLQDILTRTFPDALNLLQAGQAVVEISG